MIFLLRPKVQTIICKRKKMCIEQSISIGYLWISTRVHWCIWIYEFSYWDLKFFVYYDFLRLICLVFIIKLHLISFTRFSMSCTLLFFIEFIQTDRYFLITGLLDILNTSLNNDEFLQFQKHQQYLKS